MANILGTIYFRPETVANLRLGLFGRNIEDFITLLMQQGYSALTLRLKIQWIKRWDRWLYKRTINIAKLDETLITKFVKTLPLLSHLRCKHFLLQPNVHSTIKTVFLRLSNS